MAGGNSPDRQDAGRSGTGVSPFGTAGGPVPEPADGSHAFLLIYALANAGAVIAYAPFLSLLLPSRMAVLAGAYRVEWLSLAALVGAVSASLSNLLFGWLSDVTGSRRGVAAVGLAAIAISYAGCAAAATPMALVAAVAMFQLAVNMLLAPLTAWAADAVPDARKGLLGGLLGLGPAAGALAGVAATAPGIGGEDARLALVAAMMAALVLPLLLVGHEERSSPAARAPRTTAVAASETATVARRDLVLLWIGRLLVQVAGIVPGAYLLDIVEVLPSPAGRPWVARLLAAAMVGGAFAALLAGRASDRAGVRRPFLVAAAAAMTAGLAVMAAGSAQLPVAAGFLLFALGLAVFLPLQATFAMQLLPRPDRRGRDLGLLNLANTLPAVVGPLLAATLVPGHGFSVLLWMLAGGTAVAGGCAMAVCCDRQCP